MRGAEVEIATIATPNKSGSNEGTRPDDTMRRRGFHAKKQPERTSKPGAAGGASGYPSEARGGGWWGQRPRRTTPPRRRAAPTPRRTPAIRPPRHQHTPPLTKEASQG